MAASTRIPAPDDNSSHASDELSRDALDRLFATQTADRRRLPLAAGDLPADQVETGLAFALLAALL